MTTEVTLAAAVEDGSFDQVEIRAKVGDNFAAIMAAIKAHYARFYGFRAPVSPSPNWDEGYFDAMAGLPNRIASPNYCEGYEAALRTRAAK